VFSEDNASTSGGAQDTSLPSSVVKYTFQVLPQPCTFSCNKCELSRDSARTQIGAAIVHVDALSNCSHSCLNAHAYSVMCKAVPKGIFSQEYIRCKGMRVYFGRISKQPKTEERLAASRLAGTTCMRYPNNPTNFVVLLKCRMPYLYFYFLFWRCLSVLRRARMTPQLH
jgi:hypothetical protein